MSKVMMTTRPKVVKLPPIAEKGRLNLIGEFVFENSVYLLVEYGLKFDIHKGHGSSRIRFMYYYLPSTRQRREHADQRLDFENSVFHYSNLQILMTIFHNLKNTFTHTQIIRNLSYDIINKL